MKLHPRHFPTTAAANELRGFLIELEKRHELTFGEVFSMLSLQMAEQAKYMVRQEREDDET